LDTRVDVRPMLERLVWISMPVGHSNGGMT
jgi:hypothetical protein